MKKHVNGKSHRANKGNIASERAERKRQKKAARFGGSFNGTPIPMTARTDLPPGHKIAGGHHVQRPRPVAPLSQPSYYGGLRY